MTCSKNVTLFLRGRQENSETMVKETVQMEHWLQRSRRKKSYGTVASLVQEPQELWQVLFGSTSHNVDFGLRGLQEHYPLMITDFATGFDDEGNEYFTFSERRTKTRNEGLKPKEGQKKLKMFATSGLRCIVELFKQYKLRRPEQLRNKGKFYFQPINIPVTEVWFKILPMGKNSIGDLMKEMKLNSPLKDLCPDKSLTNHMARKTVVMTLQSQGVQRSDIISITGHTTIRGLDAYDEGVNGFQRVFV